jgi:hypothetical protein
MYIQRGNTSRRNRLRNWRTCTHTQTHTHRCTFSAAIQVDGIASINLATDSSTCKEEKDPLTGTLVASSPGGVFSQLEATVEFKAYAWAFLDLTFLKPRSDVFTLISGTTPMVVAGPFCFSVGRLREGKYPISASMPAIASEKSVLRLGSEVRAHVCGLDLRYVCMFVAWIWGTCACLWLGSEVRVHVCGLGLNKHVVHTHIETHKPFTNSSSMVHSIPICVQTWWTLIDYRRIYVCIYVYIYTHI